MDGLDWWAGLDWWIGGLAEWKLAAWGLEVLQVKSSTRDRDGSADIRNSDRILNIITFIIIILALLLI